MGKNNITFILLVYANFLYSQNQTMNWFFGQNAGITFSTNPPTFLAGGQMNTYEGTSVASDNIGNLLFYSDGISVIGKNHILMPNGCCLSGSNTCTQSCLIIPQPGSSTQYYLFTPPSESSTDSLRYSIVDLTLNSGFGDVVVKNSGLMANPTEKLAAIFHSNGTDIWLITHSFYSADYYSWLITSSGISSTPVISTVGSLYNNSFGNKVGYLKFSPCGNKLASAINHNDILEIFDFDNLTGALSNPIQLGVWPNTTGYGVYGVEFSPDASKLYASLLNPAIVIQYNLLAGSSSAIIASANIIGTSPNNFNGALQLGQDGKIYLAKNGDNFLACITSPNLSGNSCNYLENYVSLSSAACSLGLPSFFSSYFCGLFSGIHNYNAENKLLTLFPNPVQSTLTISFRNIKNIRVINLPGTVIMERTFLLETNDILELDVSSLTAGIYFIEAGNERRKFVKE